MGVKREVLALVLMVCLMFSSVLMSCGNSGGNQDQATTQEAGQSDSQLAESQNGNSEKTKLRVAWWGNSERDQLMYAINDLFMKEHPDVEIVTESPGWDDYWVNQATAFASGSAADVVQFQSNQFGEYASKGVLTPLESYIESGIIDLDNWNMDLVNTGIYNDNLYFLTCGVTAQSLFVNETLLKETGIKLWDFEEDITWSEFEAYLNELQSKLPADTYAGFDFYSNNDLIWVWIRQHSTDGYEWVDSEGKFAPSLETLSSWFDISQRLRQSSAFPNVEWTTEWNTKAWQEGALVSRKVVFFFENANKYKIYQNNVEDNIELRKVPISDEDKAGDLIISSAWGIPETSKNKELAAEYINFFNNNVEAQKIYNMEIGVPGSLTIQEILAKTADPSDIIAMDYMNMIAETAPAFIAKAPGVWAIQDSIRSAAEMVAFGNMTPAEAAEHIIQTANDVIAENAK